MIHSINRMAAKRIWLWASHPMRDGVFSFYFLCSHDESPGNFSSNEMFELVNANDMMSSVLTHLVLRILALLAILLALHAPLAAAVQLLAER